MAETIQIRLSPEAAADAKSIVAEAAKVLRISPKKIQDYRLLKRSIDARQRAIKVNLKLTVYLDGETIMPYSYVREYPNVKDKKSVIIVGAGPAGLFAALELIELGLKPIILERGKDVRSRRRDLAAINKEHIVNPESNYCFGEGGAGTYSDGKLYTRSNKRGDVNKCLEIFVAHGAEEDILVDAHPHIGTNKLPHIITAMRDTILNAGGEIHFNTKVIDFKIAQNQIKGVLTQDEKLWEAEQVILATGHSARDIFELLHRKNILIENKPFALGVRIEHPQSIIDRIQYKRADRGEYLPPASYRIVQQVNGCGVYSFCMCPGGIIAPCATAPGEVVTNGWSPSKRNNPYANSGIVVSVMEDDLKPYAEHGPLAGLYFQAAVEKKAWELGGQTQTAPAQRLMDFIQGKVSKDLPKCSYQPGITSVSLDEVLPQRIAESLRLAFPAFGKKMPAYLTNEAVLVGVESRTSSPVRIPRDKVSLEHPEVKGLYPCAEGAGYAGGIVSAAIDGMRCAEKISLELRN